MVLRDADIPGIVEGDGCSDALAPSEVVCVVAARDEQPRQGTQRAKLHVAELVPRRDEGVLKEVLSIFGVVRERERVSKHVGCVSVMKLGQRTGLATQCACDQLMISGKYHTL